MNRIPLLDEKCIGAFVASAVGDALGWPNEFRSGNINANKTPLGDFIEWNRRDGGKYWNHIETILEGEYSDDTQMILAVSRSLLSGKPWQVHFTSSELPFWLEYERGGGRALLNAAKSWKNKIEPWKNVGAKDYFNAGGNGAAMRVLPHVILHINESNFDVIKNEVLNDAILTHGHPRAIIGALCYAYALYYLLKKRDILNFGELVNAVISARDLWSNFEWDFSTEWLEYANKYFSYKEQWEKDTEGVIAQLKMVTKSLERGALDSEVETLEMLGCFNRSVNGAGDVAAVAAIYLSSKYANNPILGIKSAANAFGSDTDTIASMTGGLLGAILGLSWMPIEWKRVQDYDCLVYVAGCLLSKNGIELSKPNIETNELRWERSTIGLCRKLESYELQSGKASLIYVSKYITMLGQTFYRKKYSRKKFHNNIEIYTSKNEERSLFSIDRNRIYKFIDDADIKNVSFFDVIKIVEMIDRGVKDLFYISNELKLSVDTIQKIKSLIIIDNN